MKAHENPGLVRWTLGVLILACAALPAVAQDSRVDLLRSVTTAQVKPNALLVVDLSASMQCDLQAAFWPEGTEALFGTTDKRTCVDQSGLPTGVRTGEFIGPDGVGLCSPTRPEDFAFAGWQLEASGTGKGSGSCAGDAECLLPFAGTVFSDGDARWRWHDASRLAVVKNLIGDSMDIETLDQPMSMAHAPTPWVDVSKGIPPRPEPLSTRFQPAVGFVEDNFDRINFGLGVFSCLSCHSRNIGDYEYEERGSDPKPSCKVTNDDFADGCGKNGDFFDPDDPSDISDPVYKTMVRINTEDLDTVAQEYVRDAINALMKPTTAATTLTDPDTGIASTIRGLESYTATPTPCAIRCAQTEFERFVFPTDSKLALCQRRNYVILITDGQSTEINGGHNIKVCDNQMPWDMADAMYNQTRANPILAANPEGAVRTFVIGLSTQTTTGSARAELNQIAFRGRTDASDTKGGVSIPGDDPYWGNFDPGRNYAFFATNAEELSRAMRRVIASIAAVDLASAPPTATKTDSIDFFQGAEVGLLPSSSFPESYGHLRLFNLEKAVGDPDYLVWDAGEELTNRDLVAAPRAIYTSDPSSIPAHQLVPLISGDAQSISDLTALLGGSVTSEEAAVLIEFLHGYPVPEDPADFWGPTHNRQWRLGDILNSTPAVRGRPPRYVHYADHQSFANTHHDRHPLVFVGANDMLLHAFDLVDGHEIFAYLPPNLLPKLVELYNNWVDDGYSHMGQPFAAADHIYGVAASPRLVDIQDPDGEWLTALLSGQGPGGEAVFALDVTTVYPGRTVGAETYLPDTGHDAAEPFRVLWFRSSADPGFEDMGETWSVPAAGPGLDTVGDPAWLAAFGGAYGDGDKGRFQHIVDAYSGALISKPSLVPLADRIGQLVTDNYFIADTVGYSTEGTAADAPLSQEIQADLAGQLWSTEVDNISHSMSPWFDVGPEQPIYFSPAVSTYTPGGPFTLASYASGTFDETDRKVNGSTAVLDARLFISVSTLDGVNKETVTIDVSDPAQLTKPDGTAFSPATRPVSSPLNILQVGRNPKAFFTLFDPEPAGGDCFGRSFIVSLEFVPDPVGGTTLVKTAYEVGAGKVSGLTPGAGMIHVGASGTDGEEAKIVPVAGSDTIVPDGSLQIEHWREIY